MSPPEENLKKDEAFADFLLDMLGTIGSDKVKSQVSVMKTYKETSDNLHKIVEYAFLREDLPESERAAVRDLLSQISASVKAFCENHNINEEKEN